MKKASILILFFISIYPLALSFQIFINWFNAEHEVFWTAAELSRKNLLKQFIFDWIQSAVFVLLTASIIFSLNTLLNPINKYLMPAFIILMSAILLYLNAPFILVCIIVVTFLLINLYYSLTSGIKK